MNQLFSNKKNQKINLRSSLKAINQEKKENRTKSNDNKKNKNKKENGFVFRKI